MRTLFVSALGLAMASSAFADYHIDFNSPGDFAAYFSSAQSGGIVASPSGGLSNSGSLDLSGLASVQQIITFNQGFSPTTASWTASIYYYGNGQNFWQFGVTTQAAPGLNDYSTPGSGEDTLPVIYLQMGTDDNGKLSVISYLPTFEAMQWDEMSIPGGLPTSDAWYRFTLSGSYLGDDSYEITGAIYQSDANGVVGSKLVDVSSEMMNFDLTASESLYFYINPGWGVTLDNFYTNLAPIPEPATFSALAAGAAVLALHTVRRRRQSA